MVLIAREGEWVPENLSVRVEIRWEVKHGQNTERSSRKRKENRRGMKERVRPW